ncbi:selenoprotein O [Bdellovibrio sp. qaytius]|nr:selenoprotein O [Bdellovibrio sp. qaytius]
MTDQTIPIYNLGNDFYDEVAPAQFPDKKLRYLNPNLKLNLIADFTPEHLWHFQPLNNNILKPLALRYHGHQFRHYNPDLGDGRGFLYAQILQGNQWYDLGTKGSGTTPWSRSGDGRLTLKGAVREALATETLESYGVNTSKTACIFETGESLVRGDEPSPTRSAVLTRFSLGHIRIGTFQRLLFLNELENIKKLTKYVLKYYYQDDIKNLDFENDLEVSTRFLQCVGDRLAKLSAQVMMAGFVHGVLNSDNINVSGELFDYGPYRFLPDYDPQFTAAYFDQQGLYSFSEQPNNFLWNFAQLTHCLVKAYPEVPGQLILENFQEQFNDHLYQAFQNKLNVRFNDDATTTEAISLFFQTVTDAPGGGKSINYEEALFTFHSSHIGRELPASIKDMASAQILKKLIAAATVIDEKANQHDYFKKEKPEMLLIDEIEAIWKEIADNDDWTLFNNKIQSLRLFRGVYSL